MGRDVSESVKQAFEKIKAMYGSSLRGMLLRLTLPHKFQDKKGFDGSQVLEYSAVSAITDAADEIYGLLKQVKKLK